jgi:hypothetical protein
MDEPRSIEQLTALANEPFFDAHYPIKSWFRTADMMVKQAKIYESENNLDMACFELTQNRYRF